MKNFFNVILIRRLAEKDLMRFFTTLRMTGLKGFTLIEILIVIAVLGVLAGAVVVAINPVEQVARAKDSQRKTAVSSLYKAVQSRLVLQGQGAYANPTENPQGWIEDLITDGEIKNKPDANSTLTSSQCIGASGDIAGYQDGYCYKTNDIFSEAVVYTSLESSSENDLCTSGNETAYFMWSSQQGGIQTVCTASESQPSASGTVIPTYDPALIGYWKLDSNGLEEINGNNGIVSEALPVTGQVSGAFSFDGANDNINIGDIEIFDFGTGSFSYVTWIKSGTANTGAVISKRQSTTTPGNQGFALYKTTSGRLNIYLDDGVNGVTRQTANSTLPDNIWTHVAVVVDRSNNLMSFYKNGSFNTSIGIGTVGNISNDRNLRFGEFSGGASDFTGSIDDVRIYNRVLSGPEISDLYESQN